MTAAPRRVVVVGGGIAGVSACGELRARGFDGQITLIEAGEEPYDRPPLSKGFLTGELSEEALRLRPPAWYEQHEVRLRLGVAATALDPGAGRVELADGSAEPADVVLLALGGRARPLPVPGGDDAAVYLLRTVEDARALRAALVPGARVLVVGGGLIGAEVASTAVALGATVVLTDPVVPPLAGAVGAQVAAALHAQHAEHGIELRTGGVVRVERGAGAAAVTAYLTGGPAPAGARNPSAAPAVVVDHERVDADVIVVGIGIEPDTDLAARAGVEVDRGIVVDGSYRTTNPAIFAAGDAARRRGAVRVEHWEAARDGGRAAAAGILGQPADPTGAPWFWSDRHGCHVEAVGVIAAGTTSVVRGELGRPPYTVFSLHDGRCVGAVAVNDPRAVRSARRLIERAIPVDPSALADPTTDLRRLVRG